MAERLADVGPNLAVYKVHVDELREQDINARVMTPEAFERLTQNVKKEGRLESLPFTVRRDLDNGKVQFEVVSGHHRLRAARQAGLTEIYVLSDERNLERGKVIAKQLAHNAISGEDDPQTLKKLYEEMQLVEDILESFISPDDFDDVSQLAPTSVSDLTVTIPWKQLSLVFMPATMEKLDIIEKWVRQVPKDSDSVGVVSNEIFNRFRDSAIAVGRTENVRSLGAIFARILDIVEQWAKDNNVPLGPIPDEKQTSVTGNSKAERVGKGSSRAKSKANVRGVIK